MTRRRLDEEGLDYVKILASNQLDEYLIHSLLEQGAPIDAFGVGTRLVTGQPDAALDGVYKLCQIDERPCLKLSENPEKIILPGRKQVFRWYRITSYNVCYTKLLRFDRTRWCRSCQHRNQHRHDER